MADSLFCQIPVPRNPLLAAELALKENPNNAQSTGISGRHKRGVGLVSNFWTPGRTLKIAFMEGAPTALQHAVFQVACQWLEYANLKFEHVDDPAQAEITIEMLPPDEGINYAWPGTEALLPEAKPTMKLSVLEDDPNFARTVLHEFGHVLGALHEHQHPDASIPWDEERLITYYSELGLSAAHVREQFLDKFERSKTYHTQYDLKSVMHYAVDPMFTLDGWSTEGNHAISEKDKTFMRIVYPK